MVLEWFLGIVATLLAGTNIWQFVNYKQERQKAKADADSATTEAKQKAIELDNAQFSYIKQQLNEALEAYQKVSDARKEESERSFEEISKLRNEILELKHTLGELKIEIGNLKEDKADADKIACEVKACKKRVPKAAIKAKKTTLAPAKPIEE